MTRRDTLHRLLLAAVLLAVGAPVFADSGAAAAPHVLAVGDAVPALALRDQHDADVQVDASTRVLLLTRDMTGGGLVKESLAENGKEMLTAAGAVYVSDVSRMPGLVLSAFALPSLRKRPYPIALDRSGDVTSVLPSADAKATVLSLDAGKIRAVTFAATSAEVTAALRQAGR